MRNKIIKAVAELMGKIEELEWQRDNGNEDESMEADYRLSKIGNHIYLYQHLIPAVMWEDDWREA